MKDQVLKAKWVEALRSGEYKQTRNYLQDEYGFCCLGVLCEVMGLENTEDDILDITRYYYEGDYNISLFPGNLGSDLEIDHDEGTLVNMNDNGKTFSEIADWIEKNL
jgi:hypothetical protein